MTSEFNIKSQNSNKQIHWNFDKCGNIHLSSVDHPDALFDVNINGKNELSCERIISHEINKVVLDENITDENITYNQYYTKGKLVIFNQSKTLRGTILKQQKLDKDENNDKDKDNDENNDNQKSDDKDLNNEYDSDDEDVIKTTYYHEDTEFNEQIDEEERDDKDDDTYNDYHYHTNSLLAPIFSFSTDDKTIKMKELDKYIIDGDDCMALYDTLIYDGNPSSCNLIFKTKLLNDLAIYRLCVYTSGHISFRPIGSSDKKYVINVDENDTINININENIKQNI
jgi:hypothetical protein